MGRRKELTITEFARMGGKALAASRTPKERREAALKALTARWARYRAKKKATAA